ncbi:MAG: hypothetical protein ABFS56_32110, partial [Pseudomonadota bacterium]
RIFVSGMERSGFPETGKTEFLFREWSGADFPKRCREFSALRLTSYREIRSAPFPIQRKCLSLLKKKSL